MIRFKFKWFPFDRRNATDSSQRSATASAKTAAASTDPNAKRVLIVDDDAVFVKATSMKLRAAGFQVKSAQDSAEAIEVLRDNPADAVLLDVNFPPDVCNGGMGAWDGFQIMNWLRGLPTAKGAQFIMVSNSDSREYRNRAAKLGALAYLPKPLHFEKLLGVMKSASGTLVKA
jgi:two-component system, sensor histidine kinase LadS